MSKVFLQEHYEVDNLITLTEVRESDLEDLVRNINSKEIYDNTLAIPYPYSIEDGKFFIDVCRKFEKLNETICNYAIRLDGEMIGGIGFLFNYGVDSHKSEFGYWIGEDYRGRGIMTSVLKKFVSMAFNFKYINRLEAHVFPENEASIRVLEKAGFQKEGIIKSNFVKEDRLRDTILYSMIKPLKDQL